MEAMLRFNLYMTDVRHGKIRFNMRAFKKISFTYIYLYIFKLYRSPGVKVR